MGADEIVPNVWLGNIHKVQSLRHRDIDHVLQVSATPMPTSVSASLQSAGIEPVWIPKNHDHDANLLSTFGEICKWIESRLRAGADVIVWEIGGGVACLVAYLMRTEHLSWPEAMDHVDYKRPGMHLNPTYIAQLEVWQDCGYNVYEIHEGRRRPKLLYMQWIDSTVERQAERDLSRYCVQS